MSTTPEPMASEHRDAAWRWLLFAAFIATVVAANWALNRYGTIDPLGPVGLDAPAGVYFAGLAFGLRDLLHERGGHRWVLAAVGAGALVSYAIGDALTIPGGHLNIAAASAVAFGASEVADWLVYTPLRLRWPVAVGASNLVGAVVDSALFLWLAFGSLNFFQGQVLGKLLMVAPVMALMWWVRPVSRWEWPPCDVTVCSRRAVMADIGDGGDLFLCEVHAGHDRLCQDSDCGWHLAHRHAEVAW